MFAEVATRPAEATAEAAAIGAMMAEPESTVSGAPLPTPEAAGVLLLLLLLSPKEPKDK